MQFLREYSGKVDELIKDKEAAKKESEAKAKEEKEVIAQAVRQLSSVWSLSTVFLYVTSCTVVVRSLSCPPSPSTNCPLLFIHAPAPLPPCFFNHFHHPVFLRPRYAVVNMQNMYQTLMPLALPAPPSAMPTGVPGMDPGYGGAPVYGMPPMY